MHPIIATIYKAADTCMFDHVMIDEEKVASFQVGDPKKSMDYFGVPSYLSQMKKRVDPVVAYGVIHCFNAIQASLQYSFFTANSSIRFDGVDSQWVIEMVDAVFASCQVRSVEDIYRTKEHIIKRLMTSGISMLRSRVVTVEEVFGTLDFEAYAKSYSDVDASLTLLGSVVCFKQDLFFKKGIFAVMMTARILPELTQKNTTYAKSIASLPVPADYQIPKMLRHYGLIVFSDELEAMVDGSVPLQENSEMELNIRAATVKVCDMVAKHNGISANDVDAWLFAHRGESDLWHHLCRTEFY